MNILFISGGNVCEIPSDGIARVNGLLAKEFVKHNHRCFLAHHGWVQADEPSIDIFCASLRMTPHEEREALKAFLIENNIDFIIISESFGNKNFYFYKLLKEIITSIGKHCPFVQHYHTIPFAEIKINYDWSYFKFHFFGNSSPIKQKVFDFLWFMTYSLLPKYAQKRINKRYEYILNHCDAMVVLSELDKQAFCRQLPQYQDRIFGFFNPLTFEAPGNVDIALKKKQVLYVGRLGETQKRLSKLLRIWKEIETRYSDVFDWELIIVGDGLDKQHYQKIAKDYSLERIEFVGQQNPANYYKESSIFTLTSAFEGFPMVIIEALQRRCVPIAFDSFENIHELITDNENGCIVKWNDCHQYAEKLHELMSNQAKHEQMATNPANYEILEKLSIETCYQNWEKLISKCFG